MTRKKVVALLPGFLSLWLLQACVPYPQRISVGSRPDTSLEACIRLENQVFVLVNTIRAYRNLPVLVMDEQLRRVARRHSQDMRSRRYFDHKSPEGLLPWDRARAARIEFSAVGENIALNVGTDDPAGYAVKGWLDSPAHRAILLDEDEYGWTHTGVGVAISERGGYYFTQLFMRPGISGK